MADKTKAHIRYKNEAGEIVPGVTTILKILNKPALVKWANNLGLQGIDSNKYVDDKAAIGTLAHAMVEAYLKGEKADTGDYSANQISQAENSLLSFFEWEEGRRIKVIKLEEPLVGGGFGGTIDCYCELDGVLTLLDFKTGKAIYPEMTYQLAAYRELLAFHDLGTDQCRILRIGRNEDEGFEEKILTNLERETEVFYHCLSIYELQKKLRRG